MNINIPILMYHDISDSDSIWCVSPKEFEKQVEELAARGYKAISLNQLSTAPEKSVIITFDDARGGVFRHAFPILKKHNFTATVFIVPEWTNGQTPSAEQYSDFLSWKQLTALKEAGWELGSHSATHLSLTDLNSAELTKQLIDSQMEIEEKTKHKPIHFCYPFGQYNTAIMEEVKKYYTTAVTTRQNFSKEQFALGRQAILRTTSHDDFKKMLKRPTLAVCMIVKNEEKNLQTCLSSIKDCADEIVIVDTGSTDKTKEIASQFTKKIVDYRWDDNFAAARNESLKHATTDWILILDADEAIEKEAQVTIKEALSNWNIDGYQLITRNYTSRTTVSGWQPALQTDPLNVNPEGWFPSIKTRLFQRRPETTFTGKIHEMVDASIPREKKMFLPIVVIHHYGTLEDSEEKRKQYMKLTKKKTEEDPTDAKAFAELGIQYKELEQFDNAEKALTTSLNIENAITPRLNLAIVQQKQQKFDEAIENYAIVIKKKPENADAHFGLGFCYVMQNKRNKGAEHFRKAIKYNRAFVDAYVNLGALYEQAQYYDQAIKILHRALAIAPTNARAYYNLAVAHEKSKNLKEALACYANAHNFGYPKRDVIKERIEKIKEYLENYRENYTAE
jgi:peptidoglycan/xylan/chitin deacetylase (PgdA/CDA1 family)/Flp pilus assembly protein TadD